jgi:hypothetical protein
MKNNTEETKLALQKALANAPQDYALNEVRYHIRAALNQLENVERKRERRHTNEVKREAVKAQGNVYAYDPFRALQAIDEEIAKTKATIVEIQRRRRKPDDEKEDGDELQTVLG